MRYKINYKRTDWQDHIVEYPNRFKETRNTDGTVLLDIDEGDIFQRGTPVNAENLNNMEIAIERLVSAVNDHSDKIMSLAVEVATLKGAILDDFDSNIFVENFRDLNDVNVDGGVWDKANSRIMV